MTRILAPLALAAALGAVFTPAAFAMNNHSAVLENSVANELPFYGFGDVDASELTSAQLGGIYSTLHSDETYGTIKAAIDNILHN
ncbi:MAG: hypothetical protein ACPGNV_12320 [Mangrovicoccus sp.]